MALDCDGIMERLDDLLDGVLSAADRDAVERHLRDCPHCRELTALVSGDLARLSDEAPDGLAEAILRRTSGSPCESARGRLCGYVDGESEPVDRELVRLHLDGCGDCAAMVGALARLAEDLPALARVEPDDRFVSELLGRTTGRLRRVERWAARLAAGWGEMLRRPRFAWEAAYVATFVVALAFTTPGSPLAGVPRTALELAETRPVAELREPVARLESRVSEENARFWRVAHERTTQTLGQTAKGAGRVSRSLGEKIRVGLGTLSERLASMQETEDNDRSSDSDDRRQGEER